MITFNKSLAFRIGLNAAVLFAHLKAIAHEDGEILNPIPLALQKDLRFFTVMEISAALWKLFSVELIIRVENKVFINQQMDSVQ